MKYVIAALSVAALAIIGFVFTWIFFMHTEVVEPGQHGVIVDKPYFFGHSGVRDEVLKDGRILLFRTSSLTAVRMTPQGVQVQFDDLSSADNILLDFESTIQYQFTDAVSLVKNFGTQDWFAANVERQYMSIVREAVKKKTMTQMMSDVAAANDVDSEVTLALQKLVIESKLPLKIIGVSLGRAKPNANVLAQMNETAAQQQRKKTLIEAEAAEIQRKKEQVAKADADNAYRNAIGLSPEQFIQLEQIKRFSEACSKSTCVIGQVPVVLGK
jgi:hypothetical protein